MPITLKVSMSGICKSFEGIMALDNVDINVVSGTIHALVGENGAGKTTLMNVLYGSLLPDEGTIEIDGKEARFRNTKDAMVHGIGMVSQHYGIIPGLTCLQNLILGSESGYLLNSKKLLERATSLADNLGYSVDWESDAGLLSPSASQKLEILKLLWKNATLLILDEPTAMLSPSDSEALFGSLKELTTKGTTVILVTHRISDVLDHCNTVTVLRRGKVVTERSTAGLTKEQLSDDIIGHTVASDSPPIESRKVSSEILVNAQDVQVMNDRGAVALDNVNIVLRSGEVVGLAGVDGNGQKELVELLMGLRSISEGELYLFGLNALTLSLSQRISMGMRVIPEDRSRDGIIENWDIELNSSLGLQRLQPLNRQGWIQKEERRKLTDQVVQKFNAQVAGQTSTMASLSGGNQQRFVNARALSLHPKIVLAFQPARGLDFRAIEQVYGALKQACNDGATALIVSFDLDELLDHCDRILVAFGGKIVAPPTGKSKDRTVIGRLMVGALE